MSRLVFGFHIVAVLFLWQAPAYADTDDTDEAIFGIPEATSVEYSPERHVDPVALLPIEVNGKWGYADRRGDVVVEPKYEWVDYLYGPFKDEDIRQVWIARYLYEGKMDWIVFTGRKRSQSNMLKANEFRVHNGGWGAATRYASAYVVMGQGTDDARHYYLKKLDGEWMTDAIYTGMLQVKSGYSAVEIDGRCGLIDRRGEVVVPLEFAEIRSIWDGLAAVRLPDAQGGAWGFIGKSGKIRFRDKAGEIEDLLSYHHGLAGVKVGGKWGFLDKAQRGRVKPIYDEVRDFAGCCAAVRRGTEWGYIDVTGKEVAWGYDGAWSFEDEKRTGSHGSVQEIRAAKLGLVLQDGGYGYVDRTGRVALEPRYENALPFFRGVARVKCGDSFAYIDQRGRVIWDPRRVSKYGIRGLSVPPKAEPRWPGLPQADGSWGEPYPFEYDVEDHLPYEQKRPHENPEPQRQ